MSAYILNIVEGVTTYEQRDGTMWVVTSHSVDYLNSLLNFNITDYVKQAIGEPT